ncbi:MAG: glycogen synthase [Acidobacteriota bacterium]
MLALARVKVLSVSSELVPFAKTGGLADVCAALPRALRQQGHELQVYLPLYKQIKRDGLVLTPLPELQNLECVLGRDTVRFSVVATVLPDSDVPVHLIDCPPMFHRDGIYTSDDDETLRFVLLCHAALIASHRLGFAPGIVHAHDWQASLLPLLLDTTYRWSSFLAGARSVLTIHNLNYQGRCPAAMLGSLGLPESAHARLHQDNLRAGFINLLLTGILHADVLTTVSPTYAHEIQTEEFGAGLHPYLAARRDRLFGILNGVDDTWDPAHDALIPATFGIESIDRKTLNRDALLSKTGLRPAPPDVAVFGIVSRLASQKGFQLLQDTLPRLFLQADARLVVLGSGEPRFEEFFSQFQQQQPGRVCFYRGFSNELAHLIEAGADIFLMPSRYEPCGLNQMYSLRYGTVPLVRRVGGLADTVRAWDPTTGQGNGFLFDAFTPEAFWDALVDTLRAFDDPAQWRQIQRNGMAADFSWGRQAQRYGALYERLAALG